MNVIISRRQPIQFVEPGDRIVVNDDEFVVNEITRKSDCWVIGTHPVNRLEGRQRLHTFPLDHKVSLALTEDELDEVIEHIKGLGEEWQVTVVAEAPQRPALVPEPALPLPGVGE